jgi:hypothetical protein
MFRQMSLQYGKQTVYSKEIEKFMCSFLKCDLTKVFDQYLRTTEIPELEYGIKNGNLYYKWTNCVKGFNMPIRLHDSATWIKPTTELQQLKFRKEEIIVDDNFYINIKKIKS